jgi:hypothetical protein
VLFCIKCRIKLGVALGFSHADLEFGESSSTKSIFEKAGTPAKMLQLGKSLSNLRAEYQPTCSSLDHFIPEDSEAPSGCDVSYKCERQCRITLSKSVYSLAPTFIISSLYIAYLAYNVYMPADQDQDSSSEDTDDMAYVALPESCEEEKKDLIDLEEDNEEGKVSKSKKAFEISKNLILESQDRYSASGLKSFWRDKQAMEAASVAFADLSALSKFLLTAVSVYLAFVPTQMTTCQDYKSKENAEGTFPGQALQGECSPVVDMGMPKKVFATAAMVSFASFILGTYLRRTESRELARDGGLKKIVAVAPISIFVGLVCMLAAIAVVNGSTPSFECPSKPALAGEKCTVDWQLPAKNLRRLDSAPPFLLNATNTPPTPTPNDDDVAPPNSTLATRTESIPCAQQCTTAVPEGVLDLIANLIFACVYFFINYLR